jgi:hypothetical protein
MGCDCRRLAFGRVVTWAGKQVAAKEDRFGAAMPPATAKQGADSLLLSVSSRCGRAGHERVRPVRGAEPADGSGLGCRDRHEVSQIQRDLSGRARMSMTRAFFRTK